MAEGSYIDAEGFLHENPSAMSTKEARSWWYYQMRHNPNQQKQKPTHPNGGYQPYRAGYGAYSGWYAIQRSFWRRYEIEA